MSVEDYVDSIAPPPEWLQNLWAASKRRGTDKLTSRQIDLIIGKPVESCKPDRTADAGCSGHERSRLGTSRHAENERLVLSLALKSKFVALASEPIWTEYETALRGSELKLRPAEVERTLTGDCCIQPRGRRREL